jgi:hypothetical protein
MKITTKLLDDNVNKAYQIIRKYNPKMAKHVCRTFSIHLVDKPAMNALLKQDKKLREFHGYLAVIDMRQQGRAKETDIMILKEMKNEAELLACIVHEFYHSCLFFSRRINSEKLVEKLTSSTMWKYYTDKVIEETREWKLDD